MIANVRLPNKYHLRSKNKREKKSWLHVFPAKLPSPLKSQPMTTTIKILGHDGDTHCFDYDPAAFAGEAHEFIDLCQRKCEALGCRIREVVIYRKSEPKDESSQKCP